MLGSAHSRTSIHRTTTIADNTGPELVSAAAYFYQVAAVIVIILSSSYSSRITGVFPGPSLEPVVNSPNQYFLFMCDISSTTAFCR
jgi:hypothetical protein